MKLNRHSNKCFSGWCQEWIRNICTIVSKYSKINSKTLQINCWHFSGTLCKHLMRIWWNNTPAFITYLWFISLTQGLVNLATWPTLSYVCFCKYSFIQRQPCLLVSSLSVGYFTLFQQSSVARLFFDIWWCRKHSSIVLLFTFMIMHNSTEYLDKYIIHNLTRILKIYCILMVIKAKFLSH